MGTLLGASSYKVCIMSRSAVPGPSIAGACNSRRRGPLAIAGASQVAISRTGTPVLIKVCGVMTPEDAEFAASAGADFIGMIMWQKAKRAVSVDTAKRIAQIARHHGAQPVGVFVDEDAGTIAEICDLAGIGIAQLHGEVARRALADLPPTLQAVYVMQSDAQGKLQTPLPGAHASNMETGERRRADWLLVDGMKAGSGEIFDWEGLQRPAGLAANGWFLAGGLEPDNVAEALRIASPTGVDVSSGVTFPDGLRKDPARIRAFIEAVQGAKCAA